MPGETGMTKENTLQIRRAELSDLDAITEIYNEAIRTTTATFDTEPKTVDQRRDWFESHGARHPVFTSKLDGKVVGWASLSKWSDRPAYDETAELSFYVKEEFQGQGIGQKLKQTMISEARKLGFHTLIARVAEGNDVSLYLNKKFGFRDVGTLKEAGRKFGQYLDVHIFQLIFD